MRSSQITVTDQFCGCGGSSQGVLRASQKYGGGIEVRLAMNHWRLAVETHNTNFPNTDHDCADIQAVDPRRYVSTDILITSPECTNHSLAKGVKRKLQETQNLFGNITIDETAVRSRATMWDVPRFAEVHNYNIVIVENVVDARSWIMWDSWLHAMHNLGYLHKCVYLNSMHAHPTPQSRDRMYVVFWKRGNKAPDLEIRPSAYCSCCESDIEAVQSWKNPQKKFGKYKQQYLYRCPHCNTVVEPYYYSAFNCIDWSIPGKRIGDRKKAISPNTEKRIRFGLDKYGSVPLALYLDQSSIVDRIHPLEKTMFTQTTRQVGSLIMPGFLSKQYGGNFNPANSPLGFDQPVHTITTKDHHAVVGLPMFVTTRYTTGVDCRVKGAYEALATQPGDVSHAVLQIPASPFIVEAFGTSHARSISERIGAQTTNVSYGLCSNDAVSAFLTYYYGNSKAGSIDGPLGTVTTRDKAAIVFNPCDNIDINDCTYRMLLPHEVQRAMAFADDYIVLGNAKERTKQLGNAVTPPAMELLIDRCVQTLL